MDKIHVHPFASVAQLADEHLAEAGLGASSVRISHTPSGHPALSIHEAHNQPWTIHQAQRFVRGFGVQRLKISHHPQPGRSEVRGTTDEITVSVTITYCGGTT